MRDIPFRRLILSGGGIRVISYLGVLKVLHEKDLLKHYKEICGVSAGAFIGLMIALKYPLRVIERLCFQYDFSNLRSIELDQAFDFLENYGIDDGSKLQGLIEKILHHKGFSPKATFGDLEVTGIRLRMWASDIQNLRPIEFSAKTTPNIEVAFALRATMAVPMYFIPLRHPETNTLLVDGCIYDNYPISHLTEEEARESLGIVFEFQKTPVAIESVNDFVGLLSSGYYMPSYRKLIDVHKDRTIVIGCNEFPPLHFEATLEEKQLLVSKGRQAAVDFFKRISLRKVERRHSVS